MLQKSHWRLLFVAIVQLLCAACIGLQQAAKQCRNLSSENTMIVHLDFLCFCADKPSCFLFVDFVGQHDRRQLLLKAAVRVQATRNGQHLRHGAAGVDQRQQATLHGDPQAAWQQSRRMALQHKALPLFAQRSACWQGCSASSPSRKTRMQRQLLGHPTQARRP